MIEIPPDELAEYDQAWAESSRILTYILDAFTDRLAEDGAEGIPREITIVGLAQWLDERWQREAVVAALSAAVVKLHDR